LIHLQQKNLFGTLRRSKVKRPIVFKSGRKNKQNIKGLHPGYQQIILSGLEHETLNLQKMLPGLQHETRNPKKMLPGLQHETRNILTRIDSLEKANKKLKKN